LNYRARCWRALSEAGDGQSPDRISSSTSRHTVSAIWHKRRRCSTLSAERLPELRFTIRSGLPTGKLQARLATEFTHLTASSDFGYVMHDATRVDLAATALAYRTQHADWESRVDSRSPTAG
jgi:IS5 family transposase